MADNHFIITTTENIPGKEYEVIGEVFGLTTQSKNVVRNIGAGLKKHCRWRNQRLYQDA